MSELWLYALILIAVLAGMSGLFFAWEGARIKRNDNDVRKASEHAVRSNRGRGPVGVTQHLHELNDEWAAKLPIGTKLFTQHQCVPEDFITHHHDWRGAILIAIEHAETAGPDMDDKAYWQKQLKVFDRAYEELGVSHAD